MKMTVRNTALLIVCFAIIGSTSNAGACEFVQPLTMAQALKRLHTHREIQQQLDRIATYCENPIWAGPLIDNGAGGILNIDVELSPNANVNHEVCGAGSLPSIREAVTCTVPEGERGNRDPSTVGFSTQGRPLWAVRMGNPNGVRVMYWTQQHGNEVASTEAALNVIRTLAFGRSRWIKNVLNRLDIVIVVRANPDGGEVGQECFLSPYPIGQPITAESCGLTRYTVDPTAGGGFIEDSEEDFRGVVGRGYDMNRYHHPDLFRPVRPKETQALIAAALAFSPEYIVDLHGDLFKGDCDIDMESIAPVPYLGGIPGATCLVDKDDDQTGSMPADDLIHFSYISNIVSNDDPSLPQSYTLGANLIRAVERRQLGLGARFSQVALDVGAVEEANPYDSIGINLVGWEVGQVPGVSLGVLAIKDGTPTIGMTTDTGFDPARLLNAVEINEVALVASLKNFAQFTQTPPSNDAAYCDIRTAVSVLVELPESVFGPNPYSEFPVMVPLLPGTVPVQYFDACSR
ncbi:MAG: hypothetical protein JXR76_04880 [Deltaproteobacteria bacterium]|nr:hypothetical protein [Deltaproteobacteria bacterium]